MPLIRVAINIPLLRYFDYRLGADMPMPAIGARVKVPFGTRSKIAVVVEHPSHSDFDSEKIKTIDEIIDTQPLLPKSIQQLLRWASEYYHHGFGEVFTQSIPALLRQGEAARFKPIRFWQRVAHEDDESLIEAQLKRAPRQLALWQRLAKGTISEAQLRQENFTSAIFTPLVKKQYIESLEQCPPKQRWHYEESQNGLKLNVEQAVAVAAINHSDGFRAFLLDGVTGSGKTEVYLQSIARVLSQGQQALVLVPEIGLTPQTLARFAQRFDVPIVAIHSGLNDNERMAAWLQASQNQAAIIIGTRSAIFTPLLKPGIIIIDEEHDGSFKQQDSFRYHARDLALVRAKLENIPIVLGSATPSLESLNNAQNARYHHLLLRQRAGNAQLAKQSLVDIRNQPLQGGLSPALMKMMRQSLARGEQVMLFLNRRGFAPALLCHECGQVCECQRCDAFFTLHQKPAHLACHRCGSQRSVPRQCEQCGSTNLVTTGLGTEQVEQVLEKLFSDYPIARIDRDSTRRKGSMEKLIDDIHAQKYRILLGTQMLAKGHHFPNVTLVALLDIDHALFSSDFRAAEKLAQLYVQVAGRAGRAEKAGQVVLQTHHCDNELLQDLINNGYSHFARFALKERQATHLPPFTHQALCRFEAHDYHKVKGLSDALFHYASHSPLAQHCLILPPCDAPQSRRAGKYRMQLLIQSHERRKLHGLVHQLHMQLPTLPLANQVRWSIDIDPQDML